MRKKNDAVEKALILLEQDSLPSEQQKDRMLAHIVATSEAEQTSSVVRLRQEKMLSGFDRLRQVVFAYPWRVAFAVSALQAAILTLLFGTQYTNLFLAFIGG